MMIELKDRPQCTQEYQEDIEIDNNEDRNSWLNQFLCSYPGPLSDLIEAVIDEVTWDEKRVRKRKAKDLQTFRLVVEIVVANLARVILLHPEGRSLLVSRDTGGRRACDNPAIPRLTFVQTLGLLEASGFLHQTIGTPSISKAKRTLSRIEPTSKLKAMVTGFGVHLGCLRRDRSGHPITLKLKEDRGFHEDPRRSLIRFKPTPETEAMSARIGRLNDFLSNAVLSFIPDGGDLVDVGDRLLRRSFTILPGQEVRFDQVGRLGGGFWQSLKSERRGNLRIEGEPIADLDFVSMHPRLAYHLLGQVWPSGDLYDLTGFLPGYENTNPDHRDGVKQGLCSLFNGGRAGRITGLPQGSTPKVLRAALVRKHPGLVSIIEPSLAGPEAPRFTPGSTTQDVGPSAAVSPPLGYRLMYRESEILLGALDRLMALGVVALPSHDGLFVAQSKQEIAQEAMQAASRDILGVSLPVKLKPVPGSSSAILENIPANSAGNLVAA